MLVLSRLNATRYRGREPYVVISIRSPGESLPKLRDDPFRVARLNLIFDDWAPSWGPDEAVLMSEEHASRLANFLARHLPSTKHVVVHCQMGISRSAGVAAGILEALGESPSEFTQPPFDPNPHVRQIVRDACRVQIAAKQSEAHRLLTDVSALPKLTHPGR